MKKAKKNEREKKEIIEAKEEFLHTPDDFIEIRVKIKREVYAESEKVRILNEFDKNHWYELMLLQGMESNGIIEFLETYGTGRVIEN